MQVTHHAGVDSLPVWSPDGTRHRVRLAPQRPLPDLRRPGRGRHRDGAHVGHRRATCSRPGRPTAASIAFTSNRSGSFDLYVLTLASREHPPAHDRLGRRVPAGVVAGRRAASCSPARPASGQTIDVMPAAGGPATVLTGLRGNEIPSWQPVAPDRGHGRLAQPGSRGGRHERDRSPAATSRPGRPCGSGRRRRRASSSCRRPRSPPRALRARAPSTSSSRRRADRRPTSPADQFTYQ